MGVSGLPDQPEMEASDTDQRPSGSRMLGRRGCSPPGTLQALSERGPYERNRKDGAFEFGMDREGRVLRYHLVRSSGSPELDDEAFAMIVRASPLPPVPPEISAQVVQLVVPVRLGCELVSACAWKVSGFVLMFGRQGPKGEPCAGFGIVAVLAFIILSSASSHAGVNVRFVNPGRYTDAGSYDTSSASV